MSEILDVYDKNKSRYESYSLAMKSLIDSLLLSENVNVHSISSRVKERRSLELKMGVKDSYKEIEDITDIVGVRIITHYSDDVDIIANVIESEFFIDKNNSIDKRASLEPDRFGYLSLHYIVSLGDNRGSLAEYKNYKDIKFEIQIRSILQHAWAEIEHDTGYKSTVSVPKEIRRKFSILAGLFELADAEFISIRNYLDKYKIEVQSKIRTDLESMPLDKVTLTEYAENSIVVQDIIKRIGSEVGLPLTIQTGPMVDNVLRHLFYMNIKSISQLEKLLLEHTDEVIKRCKVIHQRKTDISNSDSVPREILFAYLVQYLVAKNKDINEVMSYLDVVRKNASDNKDFAMELIKTFS
ncbi:hypothetical protein DVP09_21350 [Yersinia enterocolitica]|nr:hypothetical protein [Yersinia enterocolitica]EKN6386149.1 hypothetical protein [Yersinia enterocolitica]HDT6097743.1 hypothetical protein [Yersinia enterocolitica]